jgi:hypothetical protein
MFLLSFITKGVTTMHARFITATLAGIVGGFTVIASQVFAPGTAAWITFAIGVGLLVATPIPALLRDRGIVGYTLDALGGVLAVWTIIASLVFVGNAVKWLSFSEGAGFVAVALGGLVLNHVRLIRRARSAIVTGVPALAPSLVSTPTASEDARTGVAA